MVMSDPGSNVLLSQSLASVGLDSILAIQGPHAGTVAGKPDNNVIVAGRSRNHELLAAKKPVFLLLPSEMSERCMALASEITWSLGSHGIAVQRRYIQRGSIEDTYGAWCISLLELEHSLSLDANPERFDLVKKLLLRTKRLLWVAGTSDPHLSVMTGLMRTVRNENPDLDLISLALGSFSSHEVENMAHSITRIFVTKLDDKEFVIDDDICQIPRYSTDAALNWNIASQQTKSSKELMTVGEASTALQLDIQKPALLDSIYFKLDRACLSPLLPDEVEIEVRAFGIKYVLNHRSYIDYLFADRDAAPGTS
jgi:zearalenone synthase (highly reducing iterative type I polyketide synthase)